MENFLLLTQKRVRGEVQYNDGDFAELQTIGAEGDDEGLLLETIQLHIQDTDDTPRQFQERFPVGLSVDIVTTTQVTVAGERSTSLDITNSDLPVQ